MNKEHGYFDAALSDFMFDMASGGAIKHLADRGYSVDQIMNTLAFPTPRDRVEKTVYQHMLDTGMLKLSLEEENMTLRPITQKKEYELNHFLSEHIRRNGEEASFLLCPFGAWLKKDRDQLLKLLACLTGREREYILGIRWEQNKMYHILNSRMLEIGVQLALYSEMEARFYFLKEKLIFYK